MPRPKKYRMVQSHPMETYFKPQGVQAWDLKEVSLPVEGLESLRLADLEGLDQESAAARMGVSRPTFSRVLSAARLVVSQALVQGQAIRVEGGDFIVGKGPGPGVGYGRQHGRGGRGQGRGGGRRG